MFKIQSSLELDNILLTRWVNRVDAESTGLAG